jgi:hypothetical protein
MYKFIISKTRFQLVENKRLRAFRTNNKIHLSESGNWKRHHRVSNNSNSVNIR